MPKPKTLQDTTEELKEEVEVEEEDGSTEDEESEEEKSEDEAEEEEDYTPPTKEEYDKTLQERDNYKKGMLKAKSKNKKPEVKESEFVTKADMQKDRESTAIKEVLADNPEMDTDWAKFVGYIPKVSSSDDKEAIKKKIRAGYAGYQSTLDQDNTDDEDKEAKADLSKTAGNGGKTPPPHQKERKRILDTKGGGMDNWYK